MGGGGLIRDMNGTYLVGFMSYACGVNPFLAEALALRQGVCIAWIRGFRQVLCEVDCAELAPVLEDGEGLRFHVERWILKDMLGRSWRVSLAWIHREGNDVADWLARGGSFAYV
ncbi:uncharacterized protein LOC130730842 [Lotus japonicus]|uniref:uncharacterized protein LOC130730842 n=1 Tax=Lotus japonicus TaxID=34305 RepID=UPI002586F704|nr:uncharacterized protein LOC130730842 [Lotus japonicus]